MELVDEYEHWCGCVTREVEPEREGVERAIEFVKMCDAHRKNGKYPWIALQHPRGER